MAAIVATTLALLPAATAGRTAAPVCSPAGGHAAVKAPRFVRQIATGETGWFSSPSLVDLNGDGRSWRSSRRSTRRSSSTRRGTCSARARRPRAASTRRRWSPTSTVTAIPEIVVGGTGHRGGVRLPRRQLQLKQGWPASTCSGGQSPEVRGLAAADLNGDGKVEVVATTTNTSPTGAQVFVFNAAAASSSRRARRHAWPRYNRLKGGGNDLHFNKVGNHGYGAYGENVAIGNIDDDPQLEIITTFDNHQINAFNDDGTSILASKWFTNRGVRRARPADGLGAVHPLG